METKFIISFPDATAGKRSRLASQLADSLRQTKGIQTVEITRERPDTQDPGTLVSIVLGAPAVALAVKALAAWMVRNNQSGVTIVTDDKTVVMENMKSEDVPKAIAAFSSVVARAQ